MTPFQKKIKSLTKRKFLPLTLRLPPAIEKGLLEELVIKLREGDPTVRNPIIEGHLKLGVHIASRYGALYPNKIEDIIGVMGLALTRFVRKAQRNLKDNNITPYLTTNIHSQITKFVEEDHCIHIPGRTIRQYVLTGDSRLEKIPFQVASHREGEVKDEEGEFQSVQYQIIAESPDNEENIIEIRELLDKVTNNFIEKRVIELRSQGYSYREIEPQVGYAVSSIHIIIKTVEERFNKLYKA